MDMTDFTAQSMLSGNDLLINNNAAAHAGSQGYHDNIGKPIPPPRHISPRAATLASFPLGPEFHQHGTEFLLGIYIPPAQIHADLHIAIRHDRSRIPSPAPRMSERWISFSIRTSRMEAATSSKI